MSKKRAKPQRSAPSVMAMRAGPAPTITESGGRVWRLGWNTQDAKSALESLIVSHATREAVKLKRAMGGEEGPEYFSDFLNRVDQGAYHTFAPGWLHTMAGADASWLFLLSLLQHHQPHATPDDARRLLAEESEQTFVGVGIVAPDFFEAVVVQIGVEKEATPEQVRVAAAKIATAVAEKMKPSRKVPEPMPTREPVTA